MFAQTCLVAVSWLWSLAPAQAAASAPSIENEVEENIRAHHAGPRAVRDDALPREFLSRVADRIIRETFEERYRKIVTDADADRLIAAARGPSSEPPVEATAGSMRWYLMLGAAAGVLAVIVVAGMRRGRGAAR